MKGLFLGSGGDLSLGRLAFWLVFGLAVYFWLMRPAPDFPPTLEMALVSVLAYNLGSKAVNGFNYGPRATDKN